MCGYELGEFVSSWVSTRSASFLRALSGFASFCDICDCAVARVATGEGCWTDLERGSRSDVVVVELAGAGGEDSF